MADLIDRDEAIRVLSCYAETQQDLNDYHDMLMKIPAVNRWIPCSERMPEKDTSVIIYAAGHRVSAYYDAANGVFRLTEENGLFYRKSAVTHWMPMPEPPESEV